MGVTGMLGHKVARELSRSAALQVYGTVRHIDAEDAQRMPHVQLVSGVSASEMDSVIRVFARVDPDVVVNCIGIVKQHHLAKDALASLEVNALFPHRLAQLCRATDSRIIHISTDCVFSGAQGGYREDDPADARDLYGRTKLLGEITEAPGLTLRTSIIGRSLRGNLGLIDWFVDQEGGVVAGYQRAVFSGYSTLELAHLIETIIADFPALSGLYHVASEPIDKFSLLSLVKQALRLDVDIEPQQSVVLDRSLDGTRFREATGIVPPSWPDMVEAMCRDIRREMGR